MLNKVPKEVLRGWLSTTPPTNRQAAQAIGVSETTVQKIRTTGQASEPMYEKVATAYARAKGATLADYVAGMGSDASDVAAVTKDPGLLFAADTGGGQSEAKEVNLTVLDGDHADALGLDRTEPPQEPNPKAEDPADEAEAGDSDWDYVEPVSEALQANQELFLPVHGFVWMSEAENEIIDHPSFQRLRRVKQLGVAHLVYPGATHNRFEHVLGVLHITKRIIEAIHFNYERAMVEGSRQQEENKFDAAKPGKPVNAREEQLIRLCALLHDIGHLPFGHSLEDELHLLDHHDKEDRLYKVLDFKDFSSEHYDPLRQVINQRYANLNVRLALEDTVMSPAEVATSIILHKPVGRVFKLYKAHLDKQVDAGEVVTEEQVVAAFSKDMAKAGLRLEVCADIVGNTICADLLDYLHRDWHHVGKAHYFDERVFHYMEIRRMPTLDEQEEVDGITNEFSSRDRFVICIGRYPRMRTDAVSLILELLESRYNLAEGVLFHRSKLKITAMMERCLQLTFERPPTGSNKDLETQLLSMSEETFLDCLCKKDPGFVGDLKGQPEEAARQRLRLANCIRDRKLFKHVLTVPYEEVRPESVTAFQNMYGKDDQAPSFRQKALEEAEADFGLYPGELAMYCPGGKMNFKIAEVKVLISGQLHQLNEFEDTSSENLAGGHLRAQLKRFKQLWKVTFLADPKIATDLKLSAEEFREWRMLLADYLRSWVVPTSFGKTPQDLRQEVAARLAGSEVFKKVHQRRNPGVEFKLGAATEGANLLAARAADGKELSLGKHGAFPGGVPSLRSLVRMVREDSDESGATDT